MGPKRFLTTGEAAVYCGVTLRTVINWIKAGRLPAHQLPGTRGDNRISPEHLVAFMRQNRLPVPEELQQTLPEQGVKVLIVDDDKLMARAITRCLVDMPWQTFVAHDGFEAGRMYEKLQPDVMTLDLQMPKLDGFELLEQLHTRPKTKILVISAMEDHHLQRAMQLGADDAMPKPFDNEELVRRIERLLPS